MSERETARPPVSVPQIVLLGLLAVALYFGYRIIKPFVNPILIAAILAPVVHPLFRWLRNRVRGRAGLAAFLTCFVVVLVIVGPLSLLGIGVVSQAADSVRAVQGWVQEGNLDRLFSSPRLEGVREFVARALPLVDPARLDFKDLLVSASAKIGNIVATNAGKLLSSTGELVTKLVLMLFVLFFFVRDGEGMLSDLRAVSPLRGTQEEKLIAQFRSVSRSSLLGILGTAAAQGAAGGIGLAIVGFNGVFWGTVMVFTSLIPFIGTALVWVPAAVFLLITGHPVKAAFLVAWSALVVGSIDNFLRPMLMRGQAGMSTLWMFFAVLGGLQLFGLPGLLYGPLVFGLCQVLLLMYRSEFDEFLKRQAQG